MRREKVVISKASCTAGPATAENRTQRHHCRRAPSRLRGLDLRLPGRANLLDQRIRQRHVVELRSHRRAVLVRPVEELQRLTGSGRIGRLRVNQDEARARDRPARRARLIRENQVVARRTLPIRTGAKRPGTLPPSVPRPCRPCSPSACWSSCSAWRTRIRRSRLRRRSAAVMLATPSLPLAPMPVGHSTEVAAPILSLKVALDFDR